MPDSSVRVRFAPSPTGKLHIGGLRTALYNYLFARGNDGDFILRIEDTDRDRYVQGAEDDILQALHWSGLEYDEGPETGGLHSPYYQSKRQDRYREHVEELVEEGHAYLAFDTEEELEEMRTSGEHPRQYDATTRGKMTNSLTLSEEEVQKRIDRGDPYVIRLKVPTNETVRFEDLIRGSVSFESSGIDDQVLLKSDGWPTYHLANVVDDHFMDISHVIRGEEWLSSTPKHVLLYRFFGWEMPKMAHLPLILSPNGGKLSKRDADEEGIPVFVEDYREAGYEPEALVNFLAFLGWNPGTEEELFTLDELTEAFSLDRVGASGVQFDIQKLQWYNQQYVRELSTDVLVERLEPYLAEEKIAVDESYLREVIELMRDRLTFVHELVTEHDFFFEDPVEYNEDGVEKRWNPGAQGHVLAYADALEEYEGEFNSEAANDILRDLADMREVGAGDIIHPTRLAVSGRHYGPSLFAMMEVLGRVTCVRRLRKAAEELGPGA